ncbi:hypothetical protein MBRA1_003019 [Malassezia brasiliensis]|uniref:Zn(2)-C6 fungal-type domain-containing protein n=1 Tax=Malassezia brasiliensis TaxID=1821822 RepID=A0AAF0IPL8_9BASI|nr:hypothetical protein MBRA1_003019 [Malassezia brasiliensis]
MDASRGGGSRMGAKRVRALAAAIARERAPPRKRTKKAQSCDPCRRRKLKCDRGWPCGACCDRNEQDACTWEDGVVPEHTGRDAQKNTLVLQKMGVIESQLDRLLQRLDDVEARLGDRERPRGKRAREYLAHTMDSYTVGGVFGVSWQPSSDACMRRTLMHMQASMPDETTMRELLDVYASEMDWSRRFLDTDEVNARAEKVLALEARLEEDPDCIEHLSRDEVTHLIYTEAIVLAIMGLSMVFSRDSKHKERYKERDSLRLYGPYFHEAMLGLSTLNVFEEPHMDYIFSIGVCLLQTTVHVALLLDLDVEPPPSLPPLEASRRVQTFMMLCLQDWFCTTTTKRLPIIRPDPIRFPSMFGTPEQQSKYLTVAEQSRLGLAHLYSKASILDLQHDDYSVTCRLHDEAMRLRARISKEHHEPGLSESTRSIYAFIGAAGFDYFLLRIHLRFYVRGWDDPRYRLSRDTCFSSARHLLQVFRAAFSWKVPPRALIDTPNKPGEWAVPDQVSVAARMWWLSNWATAGALLLVKHLTILSERDETQHWDQEREEIVQDLCIMSRLLQYLSPITTFAHQGYEAMQRVAAHALRENFHAPPGAQDNFVAHWAARLLQMRPDAPCKGDGAACSSAEPMSLLNRMMNSSHPFSERDTTSGSFVASGTANPYPGDAHSPHLMKEGTVPPAVASDDQLDTFWAQFAMPQYQRTSPIPPIPVVTSAMPPQTDPVFSLPLPMPTGDQNEWLSNISAPDTAFLGPSRDFVTSNQFNFPMASLGPLTDDLLRMFDGFPKSENPDEPAQAINMS